MSGDAAAARPRRLRRGLARAVLVGGVGAGLWLAGASDAAADEPAPVVPPAAGAVADAVETASGLPLTGLLGTVEEQAAPAVGTPVSDAVTPVADGVTSVADAVTSVADAVTDVVAPVVEVASPVLEVVPPVVHEAPRLEPGGVPAVPGAVMEDPRRPVGVVTPADAVAPAAPIAAAPIAAAPAAPDLGPGSAAQLPPAADGAEVVVAATSPAPVLPGPVLPEPAPAPAAPAPAGSIGTSAPGADGGHAMVPADSAAAVLAAARTRSDLARDAAEDVAADPSFSPD